jgi:hypothetical protein
MQMAGMEAKLKHLDHIQAAIARMANHSFLFKGWSMTIVGALFAVAVVESKSALVAIAIVTTILFWGLDGYYLWIERGFVKLHNQVAAKSEAEIDFSMAIDKDKAFRRWLRTCLRPHLLAFYGAIVAVELIGIFVVRSK